MATATTPEHVEPQLQSNAGQAYAATPRKAWITIDNGFATAVAMAALAFAAFAYLNTRIDTLGGKIDSVATELSAEMKRYAERTDDKIEKLTERTDNKIEKLSAETNSKFEKLSEKFERLSAETNDKFDRLNDKFEKLSAETNDKFDRLTDKLNELIIAQSRAN